jgi:hypothetical protein
VSGNSRQLNQGVAANKDTRLYQPKAGAVTEGTSNQGGNQPQPQEVLDKAAGKAAEEKREVVPKAVNLDENHIVEAPKENLQGNTTTASKSDEDDSRGKETQVQQPPRGADPPYFTRCRVLGT